MNLQNVDRHKYDHSRNTPKTVAKTVEKTETWPLWFFFGVAPLAVLTGWSLVAVSLTGDWAWELPLGLMFAVAGSMIAMVSTNMRG